MAKSTLGEKQICQNCETRFFDLGQSPATCPKCGTVMEAPKPKSKSKSKAAAKAAAQSQPEDDKPEVDDEVEDLIDDDDDEDLDDDEDDQGLMEDTSDLNGDDDLGAVVVTPKDESDAG